MQKSYAGIGAIAATLMFGACATSPRVAEAPKSVSRSDRVSDANIAAIVVAANNADIAYANIALNKGMSDEVKSFARRMVADHNGVNTAAAALVAKLGVTPVENSVSLDLRDNAEVVRDRLREKNGIEFDREYIDNEISYHESLLKTIDEMLVPSVTNAELRELLRTTRPAVAAHLEHAKRIRPSLR
jgi:putative membrane protein